MLEDSEFEQGLGMLTVAFAFSYIILLRIAGAPAGTVQAHSPHILLIRTYMVPLVQTLQSEPQMQAGHTCLPSGRFLQVSPAGILSILWAQHVSGLGSSCRFS